MKSFNAFISTSEEEQINVPVTFPNTQGSFSILLNLTTYSPQPPLESLFFLGTLLCNTIPVVYYLGNSFPASFTLYFLCLASKYWVSHWPSPSWHSWVIQIPSNLALCPNDSQIFISMKTAPLIYRLLQYTISPFPEYFTGTPKQSLPKWLPPISQHVALPAFPHLGTRHYFGTKTCIYPQFLLFLLHHHIPLKDGHTPAHQKSSLNCHHHLSAGLPTTAS